MVQDSRNEDQRQNAHETQSFDTRETLPTPSGGYDQQSDPKRVWLAQWLTAIFAGLAFAAAAIYAYLAYRQVIAMNNSVIQQTKATQAAKKCRRCRYQSE
jgi:hypothetical protein